MAYAPRDSRQANHGGGSSTRGGRNNARGATSTSSAKGVFKNNQWHCNCVPQIPAERFRVKKDGKNHGRWFYTCQMQEPKRCGFFLWEDEAKVREEAAVLSNSRTEPRRESVQEGWNAGRDRTGRVHEEPIIRARAGDDGARKGLFARNERSGMVGSDAETESRASTPTPPPLPASDRTFSNGAKRTAFEAALDDHEPWDVTDDDENYMSKITDTASFETPHKVQKTGIYATPATTAKRKLPWLEPPTTPAPAAQPAESYFDTPSKLPANGNTPLAQPETPVAPPTLATATTPIPPTRHKDALANPADSASSLTSEVLSALSTTRIPADTLSTVRSILTRHDLRNQGVIKGRDISRLAIKAKDAKISELHGRINELQAALEAERSLRKIRERELERGRGRRWEKVDVKKELGLHIAMFSNISPPTRDPTADVSKCICIMSSGAMEEPYEFKALPPHARRPVPRCPLTNLNLPTTFRFFDLPAEIRDLICECALVRKEGMELSTRPSWGYKPHPSQIAALKQPPLTQVSRAIRQLSLPIFYGSNTIMVNLSRRPDNYFAQRWLLAIGPSNRKLLRDCWTIRNQPGSGVPYLRFAKMQEDYLREQGVMVKFGGFVPKYANAPERLGYGRLTFEDEDA